jgi:hypothetical protein
MLEYVVDAHDQYRASDKDREQVADRLREALDEGRLTFLEYDERLKDAYAAKTYGELDQIVADLPGASVAPPLAAQIQPRSHVAVRWVGQMWHSWVYANIICFGIWFVSVLASGGGSTQGYWPLWVAGPWGAVLLARTVSGLTSGEPRRQEQRRVEKERRKALGLDKDGNPAQRKAITGDSGVPATPYTGEPKADRIRPPD